MRDTINIMEDCIAGPFDFCKVRIGLHGPKQQVVSEAYHIDNIHWAQLEWHGPEIGFCVDNIRSKATDLDSP